MSEFFMPVWFFMYPCLSRYVCIERGDDYDDDDDDDDESDYYQPDDVVDFISSSTQSLSCFVVGWRPVLVSSAELGPETVRRLVVEQQTVGQLFVVAELGP